MIGDVDFAMAFECRGVSRSAPFDALSSLLLKKRRKAGRIFASCLSPVRCRTESYIKMQSPKKSLAIPLGIRFIRIMVIRSFIGDSKLCTVRPLPDKLLAFGPLLSLNLAGKEGRALPLYPSPVPPTASNGNPAGFRTFLRAPLRLPRSFTGKVPMNKTRMQALRVPERAAPAACTRSILVGTRSSTSRSWQLLKAPVSLEADISALW